MRTRLGKHRGTLACVCECARVCVRRKSVKLLHTLALKQRKDVSELCKTRCECEIKPCLITAVVFGHSRRIVISRRHQNRLVPRKKKEGAQKEQNTAL